MTTTPAAPESAANKVRTALGKLLRDSIMSVCGDRKIQVIEPSADLVPRAVSVVKLDHNTIATSTRNDVGGGDTVSRTITGFSYVWTRYDIQEPERIKTAMQTLAREMIDMAAAVAAVANIETVTRISVGECDVNLHALRVHGSTLVNCPVTCVVSVYG